MSRPRALVPGLLVLALSPLGAGACTWFDSVDDDGGEQDQDQDKDAVEQAEQIDAKLRAYSACRDAVAWQVSQTWLRYVDQVDEHGQPRHKREGVYIHGIGRNAFRGCRRTLASAPRTPPNMPTLQTHTQATVDAAERFAALTRELEHALDSDERDPADWSTLARIDPDLRRQFATWRSADALLEDAVDARHLSNDPLLLGVLEGRRSPLEVASRALMLESRPVARCLVREPAPQPEDCEPAFDRFDRVYGKFEALYRQDQGAADRVFWMSTFAVDAQEYHALVAEHQRKLGQRKGRDRDVQDLVDAYSALIRDAETLDFDFP